MAENEEKQRNLRLLFRRNNYEFRKQPRERKNRSPTSSIDVGSNIHLRVKTIIIF